MKNRTVNLNGNQKHIENKSFATTSKDLVSLVSELVDKYGDGRQITSEIISESLATGNAFEIGGNDYTMTINK